MRNKLLTIFQLIIWITCVFLLVSGSPLLGVGFICKSFPSGTLITWIGLVALPMALYTGFHGLRNPETRIDRFFRKVLLVILILAGSWGILAFLLSGNWAFTFDSSATGFSGSGKASWLFWKITYLIVVAEWFFIMTYMLSKWVKRSQNLGNKK
jgi:hypothetical protein